MTLALLITAVTGAWADEELTETIITTGYSGSNLTVNGTYFKVSGTQFRSDGGYNGVRIANGKTATISLIDPNSSAKATKIVLYPDGGDTDVQYVKIDGAGTYSSTDVTVSKDVSITNDGSATISWGGNVNYGVSISKIEITYTAGPVVNINDTKTEASFEMPQYDVTATYTIKRDMTVDVAGEMADRIRIKKDGNDYQAVGADGNIDANAALPTVTDNLDANTPVDMTKDTDYTLTLQKQGDTEDDWTDVTAYSVGNFRYKITGAGNYSGEIYTDPFELFEGYEVEVAAGEYATFYKDEALYVEDEDAELYTISSVSGDQAVLSDAIETAPSYTPLLIYNKGDQAKTFLLIPVDAEPNLALTVFSGFKGTLVAKTTDDTSDDYGPWNKAEGTTYYALNGLKFVYVNDAIAVGANRCWLEIGSQAQSARNIKLVFGEATGINGAYEANGASGNSDWYDLNGRKLNAAPTRKGVFIKDGKKIVIK